VPNENGSGRIERIEHALELLIDDHIQFREEHKQLLTAQVLLTDRLDKLTQTVAEAQKTMVELFRQTEERFMQTDERFMQTDERFRQTDERLKQTDERLNALIAIVDGMIRNRPRPNLD
jgi:hypothetical protein